MITGVQDVYYNVKDMEASVAFYSEVLGMEVEYSDEYWSDLRIGGVKIGLHWTGGSTVPQVPYDSHGAHAGATLTLKSDNLLEDKVSLSRNGVEIIGELDEPWGKLLVIFDPDKNIIKVMEPKH